MQEIEIDGKQVTVERIQELFRIYGIPQYMANGVYNYLNLGLPPGHFLSAVICNDLREAVERADSSNELRLAAWVKFFYNYCPSNSWGSKEIMIKWMNERRTICRLATR